MFGETEKLIQVAKIEDIVSSFKCGSLNFILFVLFVTNNKEGSTLMTETNTLIEKIDKYVTDAITANKYKMEDTIVDTMIAKKEGEVEKDDRTNL